MIVNIHEAKTNLSKLISLLEKGEDIIIARAGTPVAKLISYKKSERVPNRLKGKIKIKKDFNSINQDIINLFEGKKYL